MNKAILFWLAVLLAFSGATTLWMGWKIFRQPQAAARDGEVSSVQPPKDNSEWLTGYTLTERSGREFHSDELKGQVHVVSFFFAKCPHFCGLQNKKVQEFHEQFAEDGVRFVSITCDPENDTPEVLSEYARGFNAGEESWVFLTGKLPYIRRVAAEIYQVALDRQTHSEKLIVVDKWGNIRERFHWNGGKEEDQRMREALEQLLAETTPPAESELNGPSQSARTTAADEEFSGGAEKADVGAEDEAAEPNAATAEAVSP